MQEVTILSSSGEFKIDYDTGEILTPMEDRLEDYLDIQRFDVKEHKEYHQACCDPKKVGVIDICDIAWWNVDGEYVEAEQDWRQETTGGFN